MKKRMKRRGKWEVRKRKRGRLDKEGRFKRGHS